MEEEEKNKERKGKWGEVFIGEKGQEDEKGKRGGKRKGRRLNTREGAVFSRHTGKAAHTLTVAGTRCTQSVQA